MCSLRLVATAAVLALAAPRIRAGYIVDIVDFFQNCDNGVPMPSVNMNDLHTYQDDDGNSVINGTMVFEGEFNDPLEMKAYSTRLKQGSWVEGEISRDVPNACPLIKSSSEPWYVITRAMQQQDCPYEIGHIENFDNVVVGDLGVDNIPESFAGDWRLYVEFKTKRGAMDVTECFRIAFNIVEA